MDAKLMTLLCKKDYCCEIQRSENRMVQFWQNLLRKVWLKMCCSASNDDDDDDGTGNIHRPVF
jgi:hypothetical protein